MFYLNIILLNSCHFDAQDNWRFPLRCRAETDGKIRLKVGGAILDEIDITLLRLLQENSRCTVSELSRELNLSRPSITERIIRLQEQGVIEEFSSRICLKAVGKEVLLFIEMGALKVAPEVFESKFLNDEDILECHRVSGKSDYILKAAVNNIGAMTTLIDRLIPYGNVNTSVVLSSPVSYRHILPKSM